MRLKEEDLLKLAELKDKGKSNKDNVEAYLQSIAESLAIIANKIGRRLP
jgi:hypothetical protein